jgi:hypothetical protein
MRTRILLQMCNRSSLNVTGWSHGNRSSLTRDVSNLKPKGESARERFQSSLRRRRNRQACEGGSFSESRGNTLANVAVSWICCNQSGVLSGSVYLPKLTSCSWHRLWSRTTNRRNTIFAVTFKSSWKRMTWYRNLFSMTKPFSTRGKFNRHNVRVWGSGSPHQV